MKSAVRNICCIGCNHAKVIPGHWCYMFLKAPEVLPCAQHNKYKRIRELTGKRITKMIKEMKNPIYL